MREDLRRLCVPPDISIEEAARRIAEGGEKIVLIVDEDDRLLGVFVDGDLRRALIQHFPLDKPVSEFMSRSPKVCYADDVDAPRKAREMMIELKLEHIPVVDREGRLVDLFRWRDFFAKAFVDYPHKVVIMAGGKGTRLDPFTKILPKPLIPIGDKPIVEHIMGRFAECGFRHFVLSLNYKAEMVRMYFSDGFENFTIDYVVEDSPLGTAGSLALMKDLLRDTFFLTNCDILVDENYSRILDFHRRKGNILTVVVSQKSLTVPYGVMDVDDDGTLIGMREKPSYSFLVNTGLYVVEPEVLSFLPPGKPVSMIDLIEVLKKRDLPVGAFPIEEKSWFDVGQWNEYRRTLKHFASLSDEVLE